MNEIDKKLHKALTFFANTNVRKINYLATFQKKQYRKYVSWKIEKYIVYSDYVYIEDNKNQSNRTFIITESGLEVLRRLDDIKLKNKTFWSTVFLTILIIIISIINLWVK